MRPGARRLRGESHPRALRGAEPLHRPPRRTAQTRTRRRRDAFCYAVAAKRYALYRYDETGHPRLVPASEHEPCSHGLGHLLNPTDPDSDDRDWIVQYWEHHLNTVLGAAAGPAPSWLDNPAVGEIAITSPATYAALHRYNRGRPYPECIKPFGFLLHAPGAARTGDHRAGRLVALYRSSPEQWTAASWTDLNDPGVAVKISTDATHPGRAQVATYGSLADTYFSHTEAKAAGADGTPCRRGTIGLLRRRHVEPLDIVVVGKEATSSTTGSAACRRTPMACGGSCGTRGRMSTTPTKGAAG